MAQWLVELRGHAYDIQILQRYLREEIQVEDGKYWLAVTDPALCEHDAARTRAIRVLALCNAYAQTRMGDLPAVTAGALKSVDEDGRAVDHITMTAAVWGLHAGGPPPPPPRETDWWDLAEHDPDVMMALEYWAAPTHTWDSIYRAYEAVEKTAKAYAVNKWMGEDQRKRFKKTAHYYRHGRPDPVRDCVPMEWDEAYEFVRRLLGKWLDHKLGSR